MSPWVPAGSSTPAMPAVPATSQDSTQCKYIQAVQNTGLGRVGHSKTTAAARSSMLSRMAREHFASLAEKGSLADAAVQGASGPPSVQDIDMSDACMQMHAARMQVSDMLRHLRVRERSSRTCRPPNSCGGRFWATSAGHDICPPHAALGRSPRSEDN